MIINSNSAMRCGISEDRRSPFRRIFDRAVWRSELRDGSFRL
jgi:hypothetical protein